MFIENNIEYKCCLVCVKKKRKSSKISYKKKQQLLIDLKIKLGGKCKDCNNNDLEVLEFDHVNDDKIACVRRIYNKQGIINEANKCELRCINCHLKKTMINKKIQKNIKIIIFYIDKEIEILSILLK